MCYRKTSAANSLKNGEMEMHWVIMTMYSLTLPVLSNSSQPRTKWLFPLTVQVLASCDFLCPEMKIKVKGKGFNDVLEIQQNLHQIHNSITK
jgi:hypothetical protein